MLHLWERFVREVDYHHTPLSVKALVNALSDRMVNVGGEFSREVVPYLSREKYPIYCTGEVLPLPRRILGKAVGKKVVCGDGLLPFV